MKPLRVNADYEVELFYQKIAPPSINQTIEFFLFFLNDRDLFSSKNYSDEYLQHVKSLTHRIPQIKETGPFENFWGALTHKEDEAWFNSKMTSTELIIGQGWCGETRILNQDSSLDFLQAERSYLLKDPYAMSGQKFVKIRSIDSLEENKKIINHALTKGVQIIEPFFERKYDFSQYVFPEGKIIAYENTIDDKFQYKGSIFQRYPYAELSDLSFYQEISREKWQTFKQQTRTIIDFYGRSPNLNGYSIDSFIYEEQGELHIRVMSEINYRKTMGWVTSELARLYAGKNEWVKLILHKPIQTLKPKWEILKSLPQVMVLSPGDSRFDIYFVFEKNAQEGEKVLKQMNELLSHAQTAVEI